MDDAAPREPISQVAALATLVAAARRGGEIALGYFRDGAATPASVSYKAGDSPVTEADFAVDAALNASLRAAFPQAGWLSEESEDDSARLACETVLVLDPIDGTRAFMRGDSCWAVALALLEGGRPVAGVIHAPALGETYAAARGAGATLNGAPIRAARVETLEGARVGGPRGLRQALATQAGFRAEAGPPSPSLAYRLASVAAGRLEIGLAGPGSHDWDIAAADIILEEAGAGLVEGGMSVRYNQAGTRHHALVAAPLAWLARLAPARRGA
jgi:myo-inositol-1(or 4)-monophosphatase